MFGYVTAAVDVLKARFAFVSVELVTVFRVVEVRELRSEESDDDCPWTVLIALSRLVVEEEMRFVESVDGWAEVGVFRVEDA